MVLGMDGSWVASHDNRHGMEGKVGMMATGREVVGRRYVASFANSEQFGPMLYREAAEGGIDDGQ